LKERKGICQCVSDSGIFGASCEHTLNISRGLGITVLVLIVWVLYHCTGTLLFKLSSENEVLNSSTTTLVQNVLALTALAGVQASELYVLSHPKSQSFWIHELIIYFSQASFVHAVGAAFNVSLYWVEVSLNNGIKMNNIERSKLFFAAVIASLYILLILVLISETMARLVEAIDSMYVVVLCISFFVGANWITRKLHEGLEGLRHPQDSSEIEQQREEISRILSNSCWIAMFCVCNMLFAGMNVYSSLSKTTWLAFLSWSGVKLSILLIATTIHSHMAGDNVLPWNFKCCISIVEGIRNRRRVFVTSTSSIADD